MNAAARPNIITIAGDIGSGKSAVGKALSAALGFEYFSTGSLQRAIAEKRGMTTLELNAYSESHPEIDREIDEYSAQLGRERQHFILDSRLAWHFIPQSFKIFLSVAPREAARRILGDSARTSEHYDGLDRAHHDILERRESERRRFRQLYGLDCGDAGNYDLVVETTGVSFEAVVNVCMDAYSQWSGGEIPEKHWMAPGMLHPAACEGVCGQDGRVRIIDLDGCRHLYTGLVQVRASLNAGTALIPIAQVLRGEDRLKEGITGAEFVARHGDPAGRESGTPRS